MRKQRRRVGGVRGVVSLGPCFSKHLLQPHLLHRLVHCTGSVPEGLPHADQAVCSCRGRGREREREGERGREREREREEEMKI